MLVGALFFFGYLTSTAWTENSTDVVPMPPLINGHAILLPSGEFLFILSSYNVAPKSGVTQADEHFPHRIIGGHKISIREAPWQVVLFENGQGSCGGSLLNRYWVLTAAHCLSKPIRRYYIRAGSTFYQRSGQTRLIRRKIVHSEYNSRTLNNDIGLIKVQKPFKYNRFVRPVKLVGARWKLPKQYFVTGWGLTSENGVNLSPVLRRAQVKSINRKICARRYRHHIRITENMLCAASPERDACSGDSGGPLVFRGTQYGIVSFGIGCARENYPGLYTDIRKYRKFISYVMERY